MPSSHAMHMPRLHSWRRDLAIGVSICMHLPGNDLPPLASLRTTSTAAVCARFPIRRGFSRIGATSALGGWRRWCGAKALEKAPEMSTASTHDALFRHLLAANAFDALPMPVQCLHLQQGSRTYHGEVEVLRGRSLLSRLCAWATRLPSAGTGPIAVEIVSDGLRERWTRHVGKHAMASSLCASEGILCERLGLVTFGFRLETREGGIDWIVRRVRVLGLLPLPASWFSQVAARESADSDHYRFDVKAALPMAGLLVQYRGWLSVP